MDRCFKSDYETMTFPCRKNQLEVFGKYKSLSTKTWLCIPVKFYDQFHSNYQWSYVLVTHLYLFGLLHNISHKFDQHSNHVTLDTLGGWGQKCVIHYFLLLNCDFNAFVSKKKRKKLSLLFEMHLNWLFQSILLELQCRVSSNLIQTFFIAICLLLVHFPLTQQSVCSLSSLEPEKPI